MDSKSVISYRAVCRAADEYPKPVGYGTVTFLKGDSSTMNGPRTWCLQPFQILSSGLEGLNNGQELTVVSFASSFDRNHLS